MINDEITLYRKNGKPPWVFRYEMERAKWTHCGKRYVYAIRSFRNHRIRIEMSYAGWASFATAPKNLCDPDWLRYPNDDKYIFGGE